VEVAGRPASCGKNFRINTQELAIPAASFAVPVPGVKSISMGSFKWLDPALKSEIAPSKAGWLE
jgi:hypothetical protein